MPRLLAGNNRGLSLLDTVVGLGVLGLVGVAFMSALTTGFRTTEINDERVTAENMIRTQLEYVREQSYFTPSSVPYTVQVGDSYELPSSIIVPAGYSLTLEVNVFNDGTSDRPIAEIQKITTKVYRDGDLVATMSDLKTNR